LKARLGIFCFGERSHGSFELPVAKRAYSNYWSRTEPLDYAQNRPWHVIRHRETKPEC
jgi:hypothetical protein